MCINARSKRELAARSIEADVFYNCFDPSPPPGNRGATRSALELGEDDLVVLQPTRAIARKNIAGGLRLAMDLGAVYWLLGPPEDGYDPELERLVEAARHKIRVLAGSRVARSDDCGRLCGLRSGDASFDLGGLRQPERRVGPLPPSSRHRALPGGQGDPEFRLSDGSTSTTPHPWRLGWPSPDQDLLDRNQAVARAHFSLNDLPGRLEKWLAEGGRPVQSR